MGTIIIDMYITILPIILAGICNMLFTKTKLYREHCHPIDGKRLLRDGRRLFGEHKTWIGFLSMILFNMMTQIVWGGVLLIAGQSGRDDFYLVYADTLGYNLVIGSLTGFAYMLFELPNSFVKRRIGIAPGKTDGGVYGRSFFVIDQVDSLFGVALVLYLASHITVGKCLCYILLGALTHVGVNFVLYKCRVRKNL
ncbi:MAG: CDP-archaeol synthase [Lachnospiraceae bacterium]|nr:CDP-archaeol synthase [Lachnospiraceae bacterium]